MSCAQPQKKTKQNKKTVKKKKTKNHKLLEAKQYATRQPMDHRRNQREVKRYSKTNNDEDKTI